MLCVCVWGGGGGGGGGALRELYPHIFYSVRIIKQVIKTNAGP